MNKLKSFMEESKDNIKGLGEKLGDMKIGEKLDTLKNKIDKNIDKKKEYL